MNLKDFEAVVLEYQKPVYNHVLRLVLSKDDATDCTQDTFIKIYNNRENIDLNKNIKSFIYRVATNTALDFLRKKKRLNEVEYIEDETIVEEITYTKEEEEMIRVDTDKALSKLRENERAIILLFYREEFSYIEISKILDLPINTVKTNLRRAKFALKKHLQKYER